MRWWILVCGPLLVIAVPRFDPTAVFKNVLVPADAAVGSVIYRLRATDSLFDHPLYFEIPEENTIVSVETLNCSSFNSLCQANVILKKRLEIGRFYDFRVVVSNRKTQSATMSCSFRAMNATTPIEKIFPGAPSIFTISEFARRNTELGTIIARGNPLRERPVLLELWGSPHFSLWQRLINEKDAEGTITLLKQLDYEKSSVHNLTIFANDPWTEFGNDSRNIAAWPILVSVWDEQDTPPIFTSAPPSTALSPTLKPGDFVLSVRAVDGDRGNPRDIRYALTSEDNPFHSFFDISEDTGELRLARPLSELQAQGHTKSPILLTILAEEVRSSPDEGPAQSSTVQLALIPPPLLGTSPRFSSNVFNASLDENSPPGTVLKLDAPQITAEPGALFTLQLLNNNGTFDISPNVVEGKATTFNVRVRDPKLLDFESRRSVQCDILAKEVGEDPRNLSAIAHLVVYLNDVNDNAPIFRKLEWRAEIPENADVGTSVVKVQANETDDMARGDVNFIRLAGPGSDAFALDRETGLITVARPKELDAEKTPTLKFYVEAADENGLGNTATSTIIVDLLDINDEVPKFEKNPYEFILHANRSDFTLPAFVKAIDDDATAPNNVVRYELIEAVQNLTADAVTGELKISPVWTNTNLTTLHVRAYDGGVPRLWSEAEIRLYPPENNFRTMMFVVPGSNPNRDEIARTLSTIVGGKVTVDEVRPYTGAEGGDARREGKKSVVIATVSYPKGAAVIDVDRIQRILDQRTVKEETVTKVAEGPNLWWLFWTLLILAVIAAIVAILCCVCECCPWYIPPKRKTKVRSAEVSRLVVHGSGHGKESKSVQVAEWFGRREAWTPEANLADAEADSIRRHEMERGSDRGGGRRVQRQNHTTQPETVGRDQLYIREGNADILRLITRGNDQQRPITLVQEQPYIIDSGKDILLRRFIDQQQNEAARASVLLPNAVNKMQAENELLEASLRQQNVLLRQLLLEREREIRLETQSLPAGTQTDHDAGTQTEPLFLRPPRRKTRSDNDASDLSDDEEAKYRRRTRRSGRVPIKRKITTPIQEESETNMESEKKQQNTQATEARRLSFGHTRTSLLRKKAAEGTRAKSRSALRREVLKEISATLLHSDESDGDLRYKSRRKDVEESYSDDSLDDRSEKGSSTTRRRFSESSRSETKRPNRYYSESDLRSASLEKQIVKKEKSQSEVELHKPKLGKKRRTKGASRYMEWYTKSEGVKRKKADETAASSATSVSSKVSKGLQSGGQSSAAKKVGPEHPLLQHSERRFEVQYPRRPEDDVDSGIALTRPAMAQKKSVFTIAYDDMQTRQLRQDSATP